VFLCVPLGFWCADRCGTPGRFRASADRTDDAILAEHLAVAKEMDAARDESLENDRQLVHLDDLVCLVDRLCHVPHETANHVISRHLLTPLPTHESNPPCPASAVCCTLRCACLVVGILVHTHNIQSVGCMVAGCRQVCHAPAAGSARPHPQNRAQNRSRLHAATRPGTTQGMGSMCLRLCDSTCAGFVCAQRTLVSVSRPMIAAVSARSFADIF
jgi:hypothetical protein